MHPCSDQQEINRRSTGDRQERQRGQGPARLGTGRPRQASPTCRVHDPNANSDAERTHTGAFIRSAPIHGRTHLAAEHRGAPL